MQEKREDGSFKELGEFHQSRMGILMGEMLSQFPDADTLPSQPVLNLSIEDVDFLKSTIQTPDHAAGGRLRSEMMRELNDNMRDARAKARFSDLKAKIKSFIRK